MTSTIGEILPVAAQRFGARTALLVGDHSFSFDDLQALSNRAANGLVDAGVQPGDRVALYGPNCWEWLVAYYGIAKTGAVLIPVNVMLTPDEVRYVVEDSDTRAVIASADKGEPLLDLRGTGNLQDVVLWGDEIPPGDRVCQLALTGATGVQSGPAGRRRPGGRLLHVGDDRPPEGRDATAPRRDRCRRGHRGDGGTRA